MAEQINDIQKREKEKLKRLIQQGFDFAENCPIEFAKVLKLRIEEFSVNSQQEENRIRWRAISLGYNLSMNSRLKLRELELKKKKKRTFIKKRTR